MLYLQKSNIQMQFSSSASHWSRIYISIVASTLMLFTVSRFRADDPGTHLYHSHSGLFRGDGLFGSIVVRQPKSRDLQHDLYDLDLPEHVLVMTDWSHRPVVDLYAVFFHSRKFESQSPDSILINGRNWTHRLPLPSPIWTTLSNQRSTQASKHSIFL